MLQTLSIENLALVESLRVEFGPGLTVVTGETGAGKSLILGALTLLLGERADKALVRDGAAGCAVEAAFRVRPGGETDTLLKDSGIEPDPDGALIIRRTLSASGAGRQHVNNSAVTVQTLKRIGELLVDMHGPHDHQALLKPDAQLAVLDAYGRLDAERAAYREAYDRQHALLARRRALEADGGPDAVRQADALAFQVKELEEAALSEEEEAVIAREQTLLGGAQTVLESAGVVTQALTDSDASAFSQLAAVQQALDRLAAMAEPAAGWKQDARALAAQIQDLSHRVGAFAARIEGDPGRLQWLEERLQLYHRLKRKYGGSVADLRRLLDASRARLQDLRTRDERAAALDAECAASRARLETLGRALSRRRAAAAGRLAHAITAELQQLGFDHAGFEVRLVPVEPAPSGLDAIEFEFAPNPGEPPRPLRAIASSGEMSRVMLAVKTVLADHDRVPVLVFDEIDVNLGGRTADRVGLKLAAVSRGRQVLCITHLPQVAAHGAAHYAVSKRVSGGRTVSVMIRLDKAARLEEIAWMLAGRELTRAALVHARELLDKAAAPGRPGP